VSQPEVEKTAVRPAGLPLGRDFLRAPGIAWVLIIVVATLVRVYQLGRLSFWYDEVVTMRLARAENPAQLFERLFQIDATRAPLHPLLLQLWIKLFGPSEAAARSLSVLAGVVTIVLIFEIGRVGFDAATGLWAAWLAALSPLLIVYSREARMYALLVMITCVCWRLLLALRRSYGTAKAVAYGLSLTALVYTHPLGLLMGVTVALAGLIELRACFGTLKRWLVVHLGVFFLVLPWIRNYVDHRPESLSGRLPLRFLLGTPVGFVGGNFLVMIGLVSLIAFGVARHVLDRGPEGRWRIVRERWETPGLLLLWLIVPPTALYLYSLVSYPLFGPARYTVFVAPAYLIMIAWGLRQLRAGARYPIALGLVIVSAVAMGPTVYAPDLKADWRDFSTAVAESMAARGGDKVLVIVASADPLRNVEVETARYYLPVRCTAIASEEATPERLGPTAAGEVYFAVGSRQGKPVSPVPDRIGPYRLREEQRYPGLIVYRGFL
jgi:mannosyltransferase